MPEYTFNPETGSAEQTVNGRFSGEAQSPSLQEQADLDSARSFRNTSAYLAQKNTPSAGVGEDASLAGIEAQLLDIQQQIASDNFNNSIEREAAIAKAEALAHQAVTGSTSSPSSSYNEEKVDELNDPKALRDHIQNQYDDVPGLMQNAAKILNTEERITGFNDNLQSGDEGTVRATMETVKALKETPQHFGTAGETGVISTDAHSQAVEAFGQELADDILTISTMVNTGRISGAEAIATASKNPKLLQAILTGAQQGFWKVAL